MILIDDPFCIMQVEPLHKPTSDRGLIASISSSNPTPAKSIIGTGSIGTHAGNTTLSTCPIVASLLVCSMDTTSTTHVQKLPWNCSKAIQKYIPFELQASLCPQWFDLFVYNYLTIYYACTEKYASRIICTTRGLLHSPPNVVHVSYGIYTVIVGVLRQSDIPNSSVQATYSCIGLTIPSDMETWYQLRPDEQCSKTFSRVYQNLCRKLGQNRKVLVSFTIS